MAPPLRPAVALDPLRRRARGRRGRGARRARRRGAARADRPRHRRRRRRGARARASATACAWSPRSRSPRSTTARRRRANCTSSATASTTPAPPSPSGSPSSSPTASSARCGWPTALRGARLRARRSARSSERIAAGKPIGRPHLAEAVLAAPANAARLRGRADRRHRLADPGLPDRGQARLPPARDADRRRGRSRRSTTPAAWPIWAHPFWDISDPDEVLATIDRFSALGIDGVEAFYVTHTQRADRAAGRALRGARPAQHRLGRLPRAGEPPVLALPRLRAPTASSRTSGRSPERFALPDAALSSRQQRSSR